MTCDDCDILFQFPDELAPSLRSKFTFLCESLLGRRDDESQEIILDEMLQEMESLMSAKDGSGFSLENGKKLASCLVQAGKSSRAITLLETKLGLNRPSTKQDLQREFHYLVALGKVHKKRGNFQMALSFYERANNIAGRLDDHALLAFTLARMAVCYSSLQNPEAANHYLQLSVEMLEFFKLEDQGRTKDLMISVYKDIAFLHGIVNSDFQSSKAWYEEALKIVQNGSSPSTIKVCKLLSKISYCYSALNDARSVERYNNSVIFLVEDLLKNSACIRIHARSLIRILSRVALTYGFVELYDHEFDVSIKTLELCRNYLGDSHPEVARVASGMFKICHGLCKTDYEEAEYLTICEKSLHDCGYRENTEKARMYVRHVTDALSNCAIVFFRMKMYVKAEKYYKEALELNRSVFGELNPRNGRIMRRMARLYIRLGERQSAREMLKKSLNIYELYKPHLESFLTTLREDLANV